MARCVDQLFRRIEVFMNSKDQHLLVHVPHASTHIPENLRNDFIIGNDFIDKESKISADLYTEQLARQAWPMATIIEAKISRIVLDVERYEDDSKEIMSMFGRGIIYTRSHDGKKIRAKVSQKKRQALIEQYYVPHWKKLRDTAKGKILIDLQLICGNLNACFLTHKVHEYPNTSLRINCIHCSNEIGKRSGEHFNTITCAKTFWW